MTEIKPNAITFSAKGSVDITQAGVSPTLGAEKTAQVRNFVAEMGADISRVTSAVAQQSEKIGAAALTGGALVGLVDPTLAGAGLLAATTAHFLNAKKAEAPKETTSDVFVGPGASIAAAKPMIKGKDIGWSFFS